MATKIVYGGGETTETALHPAVITTQVLNRIEGAAAAAKASRSQARHDQC